MHQTFLWAGNSPAALQIRELIYIDRLLIINEIALHDGVYFVSSQKITFRANNITADNL